MSINLPNGRVLSCSNSNFTGFEKSMLSLANTVLPADVFPASFQETIVPEIVRLFVSAAVMVIGKLIFIGLSPPPLGFAQRSLRQCGLGFHKLAHALMQNHAKSHQYLHEPQRHLARNPKRIVFAQSVL